MRQELVSEIRTLSRRVIRATKRATFITNNETSLGVHWEGSK